MNYFFDNIDNNNGIIIINIKDKEALNNQNNSPIEKISIQNSFF